MRIKMGRPPMTDFADRFNVPAAEPGDALTVTWLGVTTLLLDDGRSALMTDGFFSRPGLLTVGVSKLQPSLERIIGCLERARVDLLDAVIPVHTHYDHALDCAVVAARTGAKLVGGASAANIGRGHQLGGDRLLVARSGEPVSLGAYDVTLIESEHSPPDRFPGIITRPLVPPARAGQFKCGEAWSTLVEHRPTGQRALIQGSAGFVPGALSGHDAEVVYLGVGQLGLLPERYLIDYWTHTVRAVGARRVILIHWDDFFRPLTEPLRALPYAADDLRATVRVLSRLGAGDGVPVHFPTVWQPENPWR